MTHKYDNPIPHSHNYSSKIHNKMTFHADSSVDGIFSGMTSWNKTVATFGLAEMEVASSSEDR